jgi:ribonuclease VapC
MTDFVLDTSAVLTYLLDEPGADRVEEIVEEARSTGSAGTGHSSILLPFIALMEVEYWLIRRSANTDAARTLLLVENWPVQIEESTPQWRHEAARIKATTPLSLADSWLAALAILRGACLLHKDPEYDQLSSLLVERLPYKARHS